MWRSLASSRRTRERVSCIQAARKKPWLLKDLDVEGYEAARRDQLLRIDPQRARFRLRISSSPIHRWGVFAQERIAAWRNVIEWKFTFKGVAEKS